MVKSRNNWNWVMSNLLLRRTTPMINKPVEEISTKPGTDLRAKPFVNVTPLIDVLLVVLIIFMVMSPLKPARFLAIVPSKPEQDAHVDQPPLHIVVTLTPDL